MGTLLIAHRGGTDCFPELTIASARRSFELGADCCEVDIRFTKDNIPVISHDANALKLFGNPANISDMTLAEFVSLRFQSDSRYHPHTLEEVLLSGVVPILFHIKEGGEPLRRILERIQAHGYEEKVTMGVMTCKDALDVKTFDSRIKVLAFMPKKKQIFEFIDSGADVIRLWEEWLTEEDIDVIHKAGKKVWVMAGSSSKGTVGYTSDENILSWKRMGVDGILVNEVARTKALL